MLSKKLLQELNQYVQSRLNPRELMMMEDSPVAAPVLKRASALPMAMERSDMLDYIQSNKKPSFRDLLWQFMDQKGVSDAAIYKRAGLDRRHFSKIRSNEEYHPGKNTVIALALALALNRGDTDTLLGAAGYTLSDSDTFDLVIAFCLSRRIYDLDDVNTALDYFSLKPLGGVSE